MVVLILNGCSLMDKVNEEEKKESQEKLSRKDSLNLRANFIGAKTEALLGNDEKARKKYKSILEKNPRHDAALFELARMYSKLHDYREALKYAERAAEIQPDNVWYRQMLVDLYQRTGRQGESREHLRWLINEENDLKYYRNLFNLERYQGNYKKALSVLEEMEELTGTNEKNMLRKVRLYQEMENYEKATQITRRLLKKDSTNPDYYKELIALYNRMDEEQKALETIKKYKRSSTDSGKADLMMANQYRRMENYEKSFSALRRAFANKKLSVDTKARIMMSQYSSEKMNDSLKKQTHILLEELQKTNPDHAATHSLMGDYHMRKGKYSKALSAYENVIRLDSSKYPVWEQVLRLQLQEGKNKKVINYSKDALKRFPEQPMIYFLKGAAETRTNQNEKAISTFKSGLYFVARTQLKIDFYSYLGDNYHEIGKHQASDEAYEKALNLDPDNQYVLNNYAYYLSLRKEKLERAAEMINKVLEEAPDNATYLDTKGWILFQQGKYNESRKILQKALENSGSNNAEILEHYGDCLFKLDKKEKAVKYWKKALGKTKNPDELKKKIENKSIKKN